MHIHTRLSNNNYPNLQTCMQVARYIVLHEFIKYINNRFLLVNIILKTLVFKNKKNKVNYTENELIDD